MAVSREKDTIAKILDAMPARAGMEACVSFFASRSGDGSIWCLAHYVAGPRSEVYRQAGAPTSDGAALAVLYEIR